MAWNNAHYPPQTDEWSVEFEEWGRICVPRATLRKLIAAYVGWSRYWLDMRTDMQESWGAFGRWSYWNPYASTYIIAQQFEMETEGEYDERWLAAIISGPSYGPNEIDWLAFPSSIREKISLPTMMDGVYPYTPSVTNMLGFYLDNYILHAIFQVKVANSLFEIVNFHFNGKAD